jgi:SNF2 family DNA or RNA helicase
LNQIASNPRLIDECYNKTSGKEIVLDELINEIINNNEKCIVWSCYIGNIDYFAEKYKVYGAVKIHGSMTIEERNRSVDLFKNNANTKLLFATPQAAKEGLTLTVANNAIFYDRTFNLDDYLQAQDRIHRISQKKKCNIYNILIENSIDDWIDALLKAKQNAAWLTQGDITIDQYEASADYSYADIIKEILKEGN